MISRVYLTEKNIPLLAKHVGSDEAELKLFMILDRRANRQSYYVIDLEKKK